LDESTLKINSLRSSHPPWHTQMYFTRLKLRVWFQV